MAWLPDWDKMQRVEVEILYQDETYGLFSTELVEVSVEADGTFRVLEQPFLDETITWGDCIRAEWVDEKTIRLLELVEHSEHTRVIYLRNLPVDRTSDNDMSANTHLQSIMKIIMDDGGFWQLEMGGLLTVFYPPGKSEQDYT
jgi:hypothetical protein